MAYSSSSSPSSITMTTTVITPDSNVKPLTLRDKDILDLVYDCYVVTKDGESFDPEALFTNVVSDVFVRSLRTCDPHLQFDEVRKTTAEVEPPIDLFKRLACQMRDTKRKDENRTNAHEKTMCILRTLAPYSWCAKAVTALAAFGLDFGLFWDLYEQKKISAATKDSLGYSLALLNNVTVFDAGYDTTKKGIDKATQAADTFVYNGVVKNVYEAVRYIVDLDRFMKTFKYKDFPAFQEVMHKYPAFVYWTVLAIVVLASQLDFLFRAPKDNLIDISTKISNLHLQLKGYKEEISQYEEYYVEYDYRDKNAFRTRTEIVQVLKCLFYDFIYFDNPQVYDEMKDPPQQVSIEVFKSNCVLVFISGLHSINDEINLLKKIYEELKQSQPRQVKGYKKDQFKILWAPIVQESVIMSDEVKTRFHEIRKNMTWHVMDYTVIPPICKDLIRNRLKYDYTTNPIVPLFSHKGELLNENALHILFTWGIPAFPWSTKDQLTLAGKWNWLWNELKKTNPTVNSWINQDTYIIVTGRTDSDWYDDQWLTKVPGALERIRKDDMVRKFDISINYYRHGEKEEDERGTIARFWAYVESTFDSLKRMNKEEDDQDTFIQVKKFLTVRQDHTGWVILSKGANVKGICGGELFAQTLNDFSEWRQTIETDSGFDVSLLRYYEFLMSKQPKDKRCSHVALKTNLTDIYHPITCPECHRQMKLISADFVCCHGYNHEVGQLDNVNNAAADDLGGGGGMIEITRQGI